MRRLCRLQLRAGRLATGADHETVSVPIAPGLASDRATGWRPGLDHSITLQCACRPFCGCAKSCPAEPLCFSDPSLAGWASRSCGPATMKSAATFPGLHVHSTRSPLVYDTCDTKAKATDRIRLASLTIHARSWSSVMPANSTGRSPPSNTVVVLSPYFLRRQLAQCPPAGIHTQPRSRRYLVVYPQLSVDHHPVPRAVVGTT